MARARKFAAVLGTRSKCQIEPECSGVMAVPGGERSGRCKPNDERQIRGKSFASYESEKERETQIRSNLACSHRAPYVPSKSLNEMRPFGTLLTEISNWT